MTLADAQPPHNAEVAHDRHSRGLPGSSSSVPRKGGGPPSGSAALGSEIGGEKDARRERQQALREGDVLPPSSEGDGGTATVGQLGFGGYGGQDQGVSLPSDTERDNMQKDRNEEWQSEQPDLRNVARTSKASGVHNDAALGPEQISMSGNRRPEELLDTVGRSLGQDSGAGGHHGEITSDASTGRPANV